LRVRKYTFSPVELEYLSKNKKLSVNQLSIALAKPFSTIKKKLAELSGKPGTKNTIARNKISRIGKRPDCNNLFFRSSYEANVFRYLRILKNKGQITEILYEPRTFAFSEFGILRGQVSYTPDFQVIYPDGTYIWIEVKGFLRPQDKTKIRRFKKYFPEDFGKLSSIVKSAKTEAAKFFVEVGSSVMLYYNDLKKHKESIPGWED
jgi:hypothetical protein